MHAEALRPATRSGLSGRSDSADGHLLQERLRLFGGLAFLIVAVFYVVGLVLVRLGVQPPLAVSAEAGLLAMLLLFGGTWLYCRRGLRTERVLRALEFLLMLMLGTLALTTTAGSVREPEIRGMVMLLEVILILFTRSIFVPSSMQRTLAVSAATSLPLAVYSLSTETARFSAWKVVWLLVAITVASAGSAVIYGLRREVRHARQLGQYTLEEKLGEGGMGVVYKARHAMLRRPTAIKLLKPERMGEAALQRFEREVQLTAGLSHPNTVTVFDYGRTPEGVFYYAMEYLEGLGLGQLVAADGPQPPARAAHILRQVLEALAEAHGLAAGAPGRQARQHHPVRAGRALGRREGRGLRPGEGPRGGWRDDPGRDSRRHPALPRPGSDPLPGGTSAPTSTPSGRLAYFLLTGRDVFEGRTIIEICGHHLHTAPVPPSERLGRALPADLEAWVLACLEKDPARRPASASEAAARLERCGLAGAWSPAEAWAWWVAKGRALAAHRGAEATPSGLTLSRPLIERAV